MADAAAKVAEQAQQQRRQPGARKALLALTFVNMLNFMDRYVASSVKELLERDLHLTDAQSALPTTGMCVVFMICSLVFGIIVDKAWLDRRRVMCVGVLFWSLATAVAGMAENLWQLVLFRSLIGVGEASYAVVAGPMLSDFYPKQERTVVYAIYGLAGPIGGALGYGLGAGLGSVYGWRVAFAMVGMPGVAAALTLLLLEDPPRGVNDDVEEAKLDDAGVKGLLRDLATIMANLHYSVATLGQVAMCFTIGGIADWGPSWLQRYHGVPLARVGIMIGAITAVAGIFGNLMGAAATEALAPTFRNAGFLASGVFAVLGGVLAMALINMEGDVNLVYALMLLSFICMFAFMAPLSAICMSAIPVGLRGRSNGLQVLLTHILGDVISPPIIGAISDKTGFLRDGMQLIWAMMMVAGVCWLVGYCVLPQLVLSSGEGKPQTPVTLPSVLCGSDLPVVEGGLDTSDEASTSDENLEEEENISSSDSTF